MKQEIFRLASYNIRKARGLDQKRLPERTTRVINGLDADIVVLQEADLRLGKRVAALPRRMIEAETDFDVVTVSTNDVSLGWHGNAVLLRRGLGVSNVQHIPLPGLEPRGAVRVDVTGGPSVVAVHLGLRRRDRLRQLHQIDLETQNASQALVAGDFNEWSPHKGLAPFEKRFSVHAPGRSFHARRPIAALDRIAVTQGLQVRNAGVEDGALARRASDHLPVWADIQINC